MAGEAHVSTPDEEPIEVVCGEPRLIPLVQHLRYRTFVRELGMAIPGADPRSRRLIAPTDGLGEMLAVFVGDEMAAGAQLVPMTRAVIDAELSIFDLDRVVPEHGECALAILKMANDARFRGSRVMSALLRAVFERFLAGGGRHVVIVAREELRAFYEGMGFVVRKWSVDVPHNGIMHVMVFDREDPRHKAGVTLAGWMFREAFAAQD
jgi:predicted GNAT family N-acyltransferase